jgi:glycosyltransferase involved in cell wall biosynthesis
MTESATAAVMSEQGQTVSVIIPTYNSSRTLALTLQTVLWQDFTDFEVLVVGDGCTDDSGKVVASFDDRRLRWINLSSNSGGPSLPRNEGLRRANGRFIAYLGHDDLWFPWHLSELVDCIKTSKSDFVYSLGVDLGPGGATGTFALTSRPRSMRENLSPTNWLHRKGLTETVGSWSPNTKVCHDREFLERVLAANAKLEFRRQLTVLKFPSVVWHTYSLGGDLPQTRYVKAMHQDAARLRDELLIEIGILMSGRCLLPYGERSLLRRSLLWLASSAISFYGYDRWPASSLLHRRWRLKSGLA